MTDAAPTMTSAKTNTSLRHVALAVSGVFLVLLFAVWPYQHWDFEVRSSVLGGILRKAEQDSEWWFCLFAPIIVGWIISRMGTELKRLPLTGSWLGVPVLLLGMLMYWFGFKADTAYPGYVAGQLITLGLILVLGGVPWLKQLFFPWLFLVFTWPMLPLERVLALPLRMMTAQASGILLNVIGVDVVREGTGLHSAANEVKGLVQGQLFQLDVEEPCSGIRSLFSLLMISGLYGWLSLKTWLPRGILFVSAIPLAMAGNMVRMVLLALGSSWFGSEFAVGRNIDGHQEMSFFHSMAGFAVFGVALLGMFVLSSYLEKRLDRPSPAKAVENEVPARRPTTWWHLGSVILILGGGLAACAVIDTSYQVAPAGLNPEMPSLLSGYVSNEQPMTAGEQSILAEDIRIERRLYTKPESAILATIVLSGAEKRSLHSPDDCLPAQGWMVGSAVPITIDTGDGHEVNATLLSMYRDVQSTDGQRARIRALNLFWYVGSGGVTCAGYQEHVVKTYTDAFFKNINHRWALVTFFVPIKRSAGGLDDPYAELTALEETKAFIKELMPRMAVKPTE